MLEKPANRPVEILRPDPKRTTRRFAFSGTFSKALRPGPKDSRGHEQLPYVPLHVFRGMEQQPQYRGWQLFAANGARLGERVWRRRAKLTQRPLHLIIEGIE